MGAREMKFLSRCSTSCTPKPCSRAAKWVEKREVKSIPGFLRGVGKLTDIPCSQPDSYPARHGSSEDTGAQQGTGVQGTTGVQQGHRSSGDHRCPAGHGSSGDHRRPARHGSSGEHRRPAGRRPARHWGTARGYSTRHLRWRNEPNEQPQFFGAGGARI